MSTNSRTPDPWLLDRGADTEVALEALAPGIGQRTLGETYDYTLIVRGETGGRRTPPANVIERYNALLERARYAGRYTLHTPIDSRPAYTPEWPSETPSLLVSLEPVNTREAIVPGCWGLLDAVSIDQEPMAPSANRSNFARLTYSIAYLADRDEFASREELTTALEYDGLF